MNSATARCVVKCTDTTHALQMASRDTTIVQAVRLKSTILMESVSHTVTHDNIFGHSQLLLLDIMSTPVPVLMVLVNTVMYLHVLVMTTAVNLKPLTPILVLTDCGMARAAQVTHCDAVTGAPDPVRSSPN